MWGVGEEWPWWENLGRGSRRGWLGLSTGGKARTEGRSPAERIDLKLLSIVDALISIFASQSHRHNSIDIQFLLLLLLLLLRPAFIP